MSITASAFLRHLTTVPLKFEEFQERIHQAVYVSATPGDYERERAGQVAEQIIRPTGLLDPEISVRPIEGQIDDLIGEINRRIEKQQRVLVTTLTKKNGGGLDRISRQCWYQVPVYAP